MKLLGSTKRKIKKKRKWWKQVKKKKSNLEITEFVLINCNVVNNSY